MNVPWLVRLVARLFWYICTYLWLVNRDFEHKHFFFASSFCFDEMGIFNQIFFSSFRSAHKFRSKILKLKPFILLVFSWNDENLWFVYSSRFFFLDIFTFILQIYVKFLNRPNILAFWYFELGKWNAQKCQLRKVLRRWTWLRLAWGKECIKQTSGWSVE